MAITQQYIDALKKQRELISELGSSSVPGLNLETIAQNLADLDENFSKTVKYFEEQADKEASKEEQAAAAAGVEETEEQKKARRDKKRQEANKKRKELLDRFVESQKEFVNEQISIIEVNYGIINQEVPSLVQTITLATTTSLQPAALGAAAPNPLFNLGLLFQTIGSIRKSIGTLKTSFLAMLIAADKIKFVLPPPVTNLLQIVLKADDLAKKVSPKTKDIDAPPPAVPAGTELVVNIGDYKTIGNNRLTITAENLVQVRKGQVADILEFLRNPDGSVKGAKIRIV